jgi:acetyl esterase/lipase
MSSTMSRNSVAAVLGLVAIGAVSWTALAGPPAGIERVKLYPEGAPGVVTVGDDNDSDPKEPTVDLYLAPKEKANGTAVVVLPGGGYGGLAMGHEGQQIGEFFTAHGVSAFVVRYRHAGRYHHPIPMEDAQRGLRYVRANAEKFGVNPHRIGVMGFSAGGHLTSTVVTHFDAGKPDAADPIEKASCRPDFGILCYPVITLTDDQYVHTGSRSNLVGEDKAKWEEMSNEKHITKETPPCFLFHTADDNAVPSENSILFYMGLRKAGVPAELHIYKSGPHGVGLAKGNPALQGWGEVLIDWMKNSGWLEPAKK